MAVTSQVTGLCPSHSVEGRLPGWNWCHTKCGTADVRTPLLAPAWFCSPELLLDQAAGPSISGAAWG